MSFPPGEWSVLLVGDQWPEDQDLMALSHGKMNRRQIKNGFAHFADILHNAQTGPLAGQQGHTADDLRDAFCQGENQSRQVAEKNGVKESAYGTAYDSTVGLQHDLTSLAEEGNKQIKEIQDSKQPVEAKVPQIVAVIDQARTLANLASAKCGGNVWARCRGSSTRKEPGSLLVSSRKPTASTSDRCSGNPKTKPACRVKYKTC